MIKFIQLSFLLGGIGVIANEQVTSTSVASTMVLVPTTSSPSMTAAKTLVFTRTTVIPTTLLPTNPGARKNDSNNLRLFIGPLLAAMVVVVVFLVVFKWKRKLKKTRNDKNKVQSVLMSDDIPLSCIVDRDSFTNIDEVNPLPVAECMGDDIKVPAKSYFSEKVLDLSVPIEGVNSTKVDSLEPTDSESKNVLSNYNSVALENEHNPMCKSKEDLHETDDKDPKDTDEKVDVRSSLERDLSVGMSLGQQTSNLKNALDQYGSATTHAGSRFRSGSKLDHPHSNFNSIAEENEQSTLSEDRSAKLTKVQVRSYSIGSVTNIGSRCNSTNSQLSEVGEDARSYSIDSGYHTGSRSISRNRAFSEIGKKVRSYSNSTSSGSNIGSRCNSTNSKLSDSDVGENVRSYSTSSGSNVGSRCNSTNSKLNDSDVGENVRSYSTSSGSNVGSRCNSTNSKLNDSDVGENLLKETRQFESKNTQSRNVSSSDATTSLSNAMRCNEPSIPNMYNDDIVKKKRADLAKKLITANGGIIKLGDVILRINSGCLAEDTEITLRIDHQHVDIKSLFDLGLIQGASSVVEFLPNGLKFLKPADLMFKHERTVSDNELFILRGSYNCNYRRIIWELVVGDIIENTKEGFVNASIEGFSFYLFILATRGVLANLLSHLNNSFTCFAYALYRRQPASNELINILVVLVSEFVDDNDEKDIKMLKDLYEAGYVKSEKGTPKRLQTDRCFQMCLDFPEYKDRPKLFYVDQPQLDSIGYVIDHFKRVPIKYPAKGTVTISEVLSEENSTAESDLPWVLEIDEKEQKAIKYKLMVRPIPTDMDPAGESTEPKVVRRNTKLTTIEITRVSRMVAMDWDSFAGLMDIPYEEREEIRTNYAKYPDSPSKAEEVLNHFNGSDCFGRDIFGKCADELGRHDLVKKLHPMEDEGDVTRADVETELLQTEMSEGNGNEEIQPEIPPEENTEPLSPREMFRLSQRIAVEWDSVGGLMDIAKEERDDIRSNVAVYSDNRSRAEKILSIFNHKRDFSRKKLVECLKGIRKLDVIRPIITGEWKVL
ncbi:uncharacterized protein LOC114527036 isoform X2 [Dendronephthya gigantea]|uniref:uncharacterized protein LOC114527036 isoform X2 n=1 Tax=Dendronephthya gigantea TaxID=151771 RepID=UPI00106A2D60|nr:uncharacterized protein LOC114527036 isoform X2 [Dendronephthya gigantea]